MKISSSAISNKGNQPLNLQVQLVGLPESVSLTSSSPGFDGKTGRFAKPLDPGKKVSLTMAMDLPDEILHRHEVLLGELRFVDADGGAVYGKQPVRIIDSRYAPPAHGTDSPPQHDRGSATQSQEGGHKH